MEVIIGNKSISLLMVRFTYLTVRFIEMLIVQSTPVCDAELTFVDVDTEETIALGDTDLTIAETSITFDSQRLPSNRQYRVEASAYNIGDHAMSEDMISKLILEFDRDILHPVCVQALMILLTVHLTRKAIMLPCSQLTLQSTL